ncbi:unnamed protein product [Cyprideis torosa]|uniref:Uncharacterized protein n=1 Tax=Cyprideis torosa TaxID=163714 RepID=A0A7R8ZSM8_9CRUS|nr:unnamed protein product [Cyprideis torosa]CAG0902081.1 unnamed protein product [Cyprideis torosa]
MTVEGRHDRGGSFFMLRSGGVWGSGGGFFVWGSGGGFFRRNHQTGQLDPPEETKPPNRTAGPSQRDETTKQDSWTLPKRRDREDWGLPPILDRWAIVFQLCTVLYWVTGVVFLIFASGKEQPWNKPDYKRNTEPAATQNGATKAKWSDKDEVDNPAFQMDQARPTY